MKEDRPFLLEVREAGRGWQQWSTYTSEANAIERKLKLEAKGLEVRVRDVREIEECVLCGEREAIPGSCLL